MRGTVPLDGGYGIDVSGGDGYDWISRCDDAGWQVPASWGRDGWDVGEWPYQVIAYRDEYPFAAMERVEGDLFMWRFDTADEVIDLVDRWVATCWLARQGQPTTPVIEVDRRNVPTDPQFRGPFSWSRLETQKENS